jgi:LPS-assembly lipoprotein
MLLDRAERGREQGEFAIMAKPAALMGVALLASLGLSSTAIGAVTGVVIGHQLDKGSSKVATTFAGAVVGGMVGKDLADGGKVLVGDGIFGFRPLYAPDAGGVTASDKLKDVDFAPIPGRVGQRIRNDLIFEATGGGGAKGTAPQYRLEVVLQENLLSQMVDIQGRVSGATYSLQASFRLVDVAQKKVVFQGTSHARAPFERFDSPYANVRAREDAENRAARIIADDLKTRLAGYLSRD